MLFTWSLLSREAAPDCSLWVERSGTLGPKPLEGEAPARGAGKQTYEADDDRVYAERRTST